jgi:transmembrane sensor
MALEGLMSEFPRSDDEARRQDAADWVVRLEAGDLAEADALAFDAWLGATPAHAQAFDAALAISQDYARNAAEVSRGLAERRADRVGHGRTVARRAVFAGGAVAAAAALAVVIAPQFAAPPSQTYATARGQHRRVELSDGSTIDLNGGARLSVSLARDRRAVTLDRGQAVFDVARDTRRPFLIAAGDRTIRVVGTQFDVRRLEGKLSVTVARGAVEVRPSEGAEGGAYRLHPGQRLDHLEGAPDVRIASTEPAEVLSWRSGRLVYRERPLADVVADLNQQFSTPIRVDDPSLAQTPISGVLVLDDQDAVIRRLALLVPIRAVRSGAGVVLRREGATGR